MALRLWRVNGEAQRAVVAASRAATILARDDAGGNAVIFRDVIRNKNCEKEQGEHRPAETKRGLATTVCSSAAPPRQPDATLSIDGQPTAPTARHTSRAAAAFGASGGRPRKRGTSAARSASLMLAQTPGPAGKIGIAAYPVSNSNYTNNLCAHRQCTKNY